MITKMLDKLFGADNVDENVTNQLPAIEVESGKNGLNFLEALSEAKQGRKITRAAWLKERANPRDFIYFLDNFDDLVNDDEESFFIDLDYRDRFKSICATDWQIAPKDLPPDTMTFREALRDVSYGFTVKRLSDPTEYSLANENILAVSKYLMDTDDWIVVDE